MKIISVKKRFDRTIQIETDAILPNGKCFIDLHVNLPSYAKDEDYRALSAATEMIAQLLADNLQKGEDQCQRM